MARLTLNVRFHCTLHSTYLLASEGLVLDQVRSGRMTRSLALSIFVDQLMEEYQAAHGCGYYSLPSSS